MTVTDSALEADVGLALDFDFSYDDALAVAPARTVGVGTGVGRSTFETDGLAVTAAGTAVQLPVADVSTDHDQIEFGGTVSASLAESDTLRPLRESGDVERVTTAFGAFRRVRRDGGDIETVVPPASVAPPFQPRDSVVLDFSLNPTSPTRYEWSATVGLEEPRPRNPIDVGEQGDPIDFATESVSVSGGATTSITLSAEAPAEDGDYLATVSPPSDSDQTLVTVAPPGVTTLSWPGASIGVGEQQVGRIQRGQDGARETVSVPLRLDAAQTAKLFAVGSRVEGAALRTADGAANYARDTVPNEELTASVSSPSGVGLDGEWVLRGWSVEVETVANERPYRATIELLDAS